MKRKKDVKRNVMVHYSVTIINNGNRKWKFAAYQKPPKSITKSLAWFVSEDYVVRGDQVFFEWDINYQFVWNRKGELSPGVTFIASGHKGCDPVVQNQTTFTDIKNTPRLSAATSGGPTGQLTIVDGVEVPPHRYSVGIAMSGNGVFAEVAGPRVTHTFTPHPNYWIRSMNDVTLGEVMELTTTTPATQLDFPDSTYKATATLQKDNSWKVTYQ